MRRVVVSEANNQNRESLGHPPSYVGFEVSGLDALFARLKGAGVTIVSDGIVTMTGGYRVVLVRDLDTGAFVELFERPKK